MRKNSVMSKYLPLFALGAMSNVQSHRELPARGEAKPTKKMIAKRSERRKKNRVSRKSRRLNSRKFK